MDLANPQRYDMVTNYRCGESIDELERAADGEWVRFEDVSALLIAQAAQVETLKNENDDLRARVAAGATTPGTGSTASSNGGE